MRTWMTSGAVSLAAAVVFCSGALAATITVDVESDGAGGPGDCELRDAIVAANSDLAVDGCVAGSGDDRIVFDSSVSAIVLTANLPVIDDNLEINGRGQDALTIDGNDAFRMFNVTGLPSGAATFILRDIRLTRGFSATIGGCALLLNLETILFQDIVVDGCHSESNAGGAIMSANVPGSSVTLRRVTFSNNLSELSGGGVSIGAETALVEDSTFHNNRAPEAGRRGGAMAVGASTALTISRSTFWANEASGGGAAYFTSSVTAVTTIRHSTFSQNFLTGTSPAHDGGAIYNSATLTLENTVVAGNTEMNPNNDHADVVNDGGMLFTAGHNFIGQNDGAAATFPAGAQANGDQAGTAGAPLDPELDALEDNGGSTLTSLPGATSPLLDQGSCPGEEFDQRGFGNADTGLRPVLAGGGITPADDGCDVGAVEAFSVRLTPLIRDGFETP